MNFNDEFKAIIPSNLNQKQHLIFRFYKITSSAEKLNPKESSKRILFAMGTSKVCFFLLHFFSNLLFLKRYLMEKKF